MDKIVRSPAVAGLFYPADPGELVDMVDQMLAAPAQEIEPASSGVLRAIQVPHAGYIYSGPVAGPAFTRFGRLNPAPSRVVIAGPVHRVPVRGVALSSATHFETPLGQVPLDQDAQVELAELPQLTYFEAAHAQEHSIEVQIPFLQRVLVDFSIIPLAVGDCPPAQVAAVFQALDTPETVFVISSDLSHYLPYDEAKQVDAETISQISELEFPLRSAQACGAYPLSGAMEYAVQRGWTPHLLSAANSADTVGDKSRVVGYSSFTFREEQ